MLVIIAIISEYSKMLTIIAVTSEEQLLVFTTYFIILGIGMQQKKKV